MIPAVRIVAVPFYFLSWYEEPFTVLASLRVDLTVDDFNFGRITVGHIAAGTKPTGKSWMVLSFCLGRMEDDWRLSAVIGLVAEHPFRRLYSADHALCDWTIVRFTSRQ
jgi:hypothetical protein